MTLSDLLLILILPAAVLLAAFCAASETAVFSLTPSDRARLRRTSPQREATIALLLARPRLFLLSVLLLTNLANVTYFVVGSVLERRLSGHAAGAALNIALLVTLILGADLLPKLLARARRIAFCSAAAPLLSAVVRTVGPLCRVLERLLIAPILRLVHPARPAGAPVLTPEELGALLELSARAGEIAEDEQRLLSDVVELGSTRVREVMTPRVAMAWIEDTAPPARVREVIRASALTWIPVFRGSLDGGPIGMLDVKRYLPAAEAAVNGPPVKVSAFLAPAVFVPESAKLDQLVEVFRRSGCGRALCVDEFGAVVGVIGIEGVVLRLVGAAGEETTGGGPGVVRIGDDRWIVSGRLPARELAAYFFGPEGARTLDARVSTVAGLIFARLGHLPHAGDSVRLGNVVLTVESMRGRAVERVGISVAPVPSGAAA